MGVDVGWIRWGGVPSGLPKGSLGVPLPRRDLLSKVVQKGDWANVLDYDEVPLLPAKKKRSALKVLGVKSVEHRGQKRKRLERFTKSNDRKWRTM